MRHNSRPGTHHDIGPDPDALPDHRTNADPAFIAHTHATRQMGPGRYVHTITNVAVMVNRGPGIDNDARSKTSPGIDSRHWHDHAPGSELRMARNKSRGMNKAHGFESGVPDLVQKQNPLPAIPQRDKDLTPGRQIGNAASGHWPRQIPLERGPALIQETDVRVTERFRNVRNHPPMPACADDPE
jgi:hypothetical protein